MSECAVAFVWMERPMNYSADEQLFPSNYGYSTIEIYGSNMPH